MIASPLRDAPGTGILHLGLGAFHRAHQAAFTQDAVAAAGGDWGIEAVSMRDPALADVLRRQGGRYTLIERHPDGPTLRDMTIIRRAHALPGNVALVARRMADTAIRVVTITVTEKGYGADVTARALNRADAGVAHDLGARDDVPRSLAGLLCLGLSLRRAVGHGGLTLMSCDNLSDNGRLLEAIVLELARARDPALAAWIAERCRFPNSMVDRITPAANEATFALAERALGRPDLAAIETEPFRQWVIEDRFAGPRPAWERAGALVVADVAPFETMKLRLLNGSHSLIAFTGALAGLSAVRDVMAEPAFRTLVRRHMTLAAETLPDVPGHDPEDYADALVERFANTAIDHRCLQIATDGSQKLPQRLFAPARLRLDRNLGIETFAFAVAAWIRFAAGRDDAGAPLALDDPLADGIRAALAAAGAGVGAGFDEIVTAFAALDGLAHHSVLDDARFRAAVARQLECLARGGTRAAVARTLAHTEPPP